MFAYKIFRIALCGNKLDNKDRKVKTIASYFIGKRSASTIYPPYRTTSRSRSCSWPGSNTNLEFVAMPVPLPPEVKMDKDWQQQNEKDLQESQSTALPDEDNYL